MLKLNKNRLARLAALEQFLKTAEQTYIDDIIAFCQLYGKDIKERMVQRARDTWKICKSNDKCSCGAPILISKSKKKYCAEICWKK